jgi:hypothetical protein
LDNQQLSLSEESSTTIPKGSTLQVKGKWETPYGVKIWSHLHRNMQRKIDMKKYYIYALLDTRKSGKFLYEEYEFP